MFRFVCGVCRGMFLGFKRKGGSGFQREFFFFFVFWDPGMGMVFFLSDREPGSSSFSFFFFVRLLDDE